MEQHATVCAKQQCLYFCVVDSIKRKAVEFMNIFNLIFRLFIMGSWLWFMVIGGGPVMAVEEAVYSLEQKDGACEVRIYASHIVAETIVGGDLEDAGDRAFNRLFRYISGDNQSSSNIAMTAPVGQQKAGRKIPMTAPVGQQAAGDQWAVSFMMPATITMENLPVPSDPSVVLREVPAQRMASIRYSGFWSEKGYQRKLAILNDWMKSKELIPMGEPVWARYNPPFTPWFLRRNEILMPIAETRK